MSRCSKIFSNPKRWACIDNAVDHATTCLIGSASEQCRRPGETLVLFTKLPIIVHHWDVSLAPNIHIPTSTKTCSMSTVSQEPTRDNTDSPHVAPTQNVIVPVTQHSQGIYAAEETGDLSGGGEHSKQRQSAT